MIEKQERSLPISFFNDIFKSMSALTLVARLMMSFIFIWSGIGKIYFYNDTANFMLAKGMQYVSFFLIGAILIEILGGIAILLGFFGRYAATLLFFYLIPTTIIFHAFWQVPEAERHLEMTMFFKNLNILGGLLYIFVFGSGSLSFDNWFNNDEPI